MSGFNSAIIEEDQSESYNPEVSSMSDNDSQINPHPLKSKKTPDFIYSKALEGSAS